MAGVCSLQPVCIMMMQLACTHGNAEWLSESRQRLRHPALLTDTSYRTGAPQLVDRHALYLLTPRQHVWEVVMHA